MRYLNILCILLCTYSCNNKHKADNKIMVFAGVGMKDAVTEIIDSFNIQNPNIEIVVNWAASGILAKQIAQGQIPDVFISANKKWVDYIDSLGFIVENKKMKVANNEIVLVVPLNSPLDTAVFDNNIKLDRIIAKGYLSIGDPSYVPVGAYAKQSLEYYNLYSKIKEKVLPARDVRSALWVVELGEVPAGIVFRSEASKSKKVKQLAVIPSESHKPIDFIATLCKNNASSKSFFRFLDTEKARNIWIKHGFY